MRGTFFHFSIADKEDSPPPFLYRVWKLAATDPARKSIPVCVLVSVCVILSSCVCVCLYLPPQTKDTDRQKGRQTKKGIHYFFYVDHVLFGGRPLELWASAIVLLWLLRRRVADVQTVALRHIQRARSSHQRPSKHSPVHNFQNTNTPSLSILTCRELQDNISAPIGKRKRERWNKLRNFEIGCYID